MNILIIEDEKPAARLFNIQRISGNNQTLNIEQRMLNFEVLKQ
jgi:hypothetical protein